MLTLFRYLKRVPWSYSDLWLDGVKIDNGKDRGYTGMSKDGMMKYVNEALLHWFLFFWIVWLFMQQAQRLAVQAHFATTLEI